MEPLQKKVWPRLDRDTDRLTGLVVSSLATQSVGMDSFQMGIQTRLLVSRWLAACRPCRPSKMGAIARLVDLQGQAEDLLRLYRID